MIGSARSWLFAALALVLFSPLAFGQTISGTVTDSSGAALPGVSVEAASPALIERSRTVVTNGAGRYSVVNLSPGTYTVTFSLDGFGTIRRQGIVLTSDFTAQVNVQLQVGGVQEQVTVTAASPVVDVQGTATPRVMTREEMDALPTSRSIPALANTIPGAIPSGPGLVNYHGSTDAVTSVDGMRTSKLDAFGAALTARTFNNAAYQEYSFSTAIESAEIGQPGLRVNLVPKDGGNQFNGSLFSTFTYSGWQGSNLTDALRQQGFKDPQTKRLWDVNPSFGGPIIRDTLWFQGSYDWTGNRNQPSDFFHDADPSPFVYRADPSRPQVIDTTSHAATGRITWQVDPKDKVAGFLEWTHNATPYFLGATSGPNAPPSAAIDNSSATKNFGVRWTRTHTSRLLLEAGYSYFPQWVSNDYGRELEAWGAIHVDNGLPTGRPPAYSILERTTGQQIGVASGASYNQSHTNNFAASATYVTGSHSIKGGFTFLNGAYYHPTSVAGLLTMAVSSGQPQSVTLVLPGNEREDINGDWGFYLQDRWSLGRLTANMGLRYDWLRTGVPDQVLPASPWLPETRFPSQKVLNYKDLSPRLGAAYDVFGTGKTAVKVALARYVAGETVGMTFRANPINKISSSDTRDWTDLNGDQTILNENGSVQWAELGPSRNLNFGKANVVTTFDENALRGWFNRGYSWETNVSVQQEVMPGIAVTALYYRRTEGNQLLDDNTLIDPSSYDAFCLTAPSDPRLPGGGGERICGLYDLKPSALGLVSNYETFATNLGTGKGISDITSGYDITANARLPRGAFLQGGINMNRTHMNTCDVVDNPEVRFCDTQSSFRPNIKINGSYALPYAVQVSATYQGLSGPEESAFWSVSSRDIASGKYDSTLGRGLISSPSKRVRLNEPGRDFLPMQHRFDLRLAKGFRFQGRRVQVLADFYNVFNNRAITGVSTTYSPTSTTWLRPTGFVAPRQFRLGAQVDF